MTTAARAITQRFLASGINTPAEMYDALSVAAVFVSREFFPKN
jgi:hypothetical protein